MRVALVERLRCASGSEANQCHGPRASIITLGSLGAVVVAPGLEAHVPTPPASVVDTTGAGDAFVGALAARLASGVEMREAVEFAVAVGSATTETVGAAPRVPRELLEQDRVRQGASRSASGSGSLT